MTSRERVLTVLNGGIPDRVPIGGGAPAASDLDETARRTLNGTDPADYFGVDVRSVSFEAGVQETALAGYIRQLPEEAWLGDVETLLGYAEWGYVPPTSQRGHQEVNPLGGVRTLEEMRQFVFPDLTAERRYRALEAKVAALHDRGLAVMGRPPRLGGVIFEAAWRLRGFDAFFVDLIERPELAAYLLDRMTFFNRINAGILAGAGVDVIYLGDDIGEPTRMLIHPDLWRRFIKPRMAQIVASARSVNPAVHALYHSDGHILPIVEDLAEIGITALNPVQPDCVDPTLIRARTGGKMTLWGTVGAQTTMFYASPEAVRREVQERVASVGRDGGLVLAPAYDLEPGAPWENLDAFFKAVDEYGWYE